MPPRDLMIWSSDYFITSEVDGIAEGRSYEIPQHLRQLLDCFNGNDLEKVYGKRELNRELVRAPKPNYASHTKL